MRRRAKRGVVRVEVDNFTERRLDESEAFDLPVLCDKVCQKCSLEGYETDASLSIHRQPFQAPLPLSISLQATQSLFAAVYHEARPNNGTLRWEV